MYYHTTTTWLDQVLERDLLDVITATGATVGARGDASPCPACGAESRGRGDRRGPVGTRDGGWHCHRCGASGDAASWASFAAAGARLDRMNWQAVRSACVAWGLCSAPEAVPGQPSGIMRPTLRLAASAPTAARDREAVQRPPREELETVWEDARSVVDADEVSAWLRGRGLDPAAVADTDLARALAPTGGLPRWASSGGGTWRSTGHLLLVPLVDEGGTTRSLRARCVRSPATPAKALAPLGHTTAGLVLADRLAQRLLEGAAMGDGSSPAAEVERVGLVIVEGDMDYLTWASRWSDAAEDAPAVIGVIGGAWSAEIAARVPDRARVVVRTHTDAVGNKYAADVAKTLMSRCNVLRGGGEA